MQRFHDNCAEGTDDFYYALALYLGGPNTSGGLYANADRQVLDWDGKPIPRLFAAREIASLFKYVGSAHLAARAEIPTASSYNRTVRKADQTGAIKHYYGWAHPR